jgi:acetyl-CoA acyltransferase
MASANEDAAAVLREYAELLVITGGDPFRSRNYEKAAKVVAGYPGDLAAVPDAALTKIPGVGTSIASKIVEFRRTGTVAAVDALRAKIPPGVQQIAKVPGIGPKRALQLSRELGIADVEDLETAVRAGRLRALSGFGAKSEEKILASIAVITRDQPLRDALRALPADADEDQIEAALTAWAAASGPKITARGATRDAHPMDNSKKRGRGSHPLVRTKDLRGDLHTHTDLTDGVATLADMIAAAAARGYEYYAVTDHAPNLVMQQMTDEKILNQRAELSVVDSHGMTLLHGAELNIAADGSVDWDADFLAGFDLCVASVHSSFGQDRAVMTARFIAAAENPYVNIIGHPLTRKLGRRPPVDVDLDALFEACARTGTALEINASPARLDLPPEYLAAARAAGVKFAIDTDAHAIGDLNNARYGIAAARFAGLTPDDVINAWPLGQLREFLAEGRSRQRLPASSISVHGVRFPGTRGIGAQPMRAREVVFVDGVRTPFGKSGPKGIYAQTRADDLIVRVIRELLRRNPDLPPAQVGEVAIAATTQIGDQGLTIGRSAAILAGLPVTVPGYAIDRMCAGAMTAVTTVAGEVALGAADIAIAGGVEHMGRHPMGEGVDPNPRFVSEGIVDESALFMGMTAENLHDRFPSITKDRADAYALDSQRKVAQAYQDGKFQPDLVPMSIRTKELGWGWATVDEPPRPETTLDGLRALKTPFRPHGRVTAGNSSGINDGATGCVLAAEDVAHELGLRAKMRLVDFSFAGVEPEVMGIGPVPATEKLLARNNLTMDDIGAIEINEAFAVQVLAFLDHFKIADDDPRVNPWGGAIALGHPLASSGVRLMIQLAAQLAERPDVRYGLATMCVGMGMGGTVLWERI